MKKVLYISRNNTLGMRFNYISEFLKNNYNAFIINLTNKIFIFSKKNKFYKFLNKLYFKLPLLPDSDILILNKYKKEVKKLLKRENIDTVIIGILPNSFLKLTKFIKSINNNIKIIIDMSDPIVPHISFTKHSRKKQKYLIKFEKNYLKYVDTLIVLNEEIKNYYMKFNIKEIIIIEQGIDSKFTKNNIRKNNNNNITTLIYAGNFYKDGREPFELYKAVSSIDNIKLNVFSSIGFFTKNFIPPTNEKFYFGGLINRDKLLEEYMNADIIVFIDNKDTIQVPGKTLEVLSLNKPILFIYFNENSPSMNYTRKYEGIYYTKNDANSIIKTITTIINDNERYYNRDLSPYFWENLVLKLNDVI